METHHGVYVLICTYIYTLDMCIYIYQFLQILCYWNVLERLIISWCLVPFTWYSLNLPTSIPCSHLVHQVIIFLNFLNINFCSYSLIATGASLWKGSAEHQVVSYGFQSTTTANILFDIFSGLGMLAFAFAFAGHSVALGLSIQRL